MAEHLELAKKAIENPLVAEGTAGPEAVGASDKLKRGITI